MSDLDDALAQRYGGASPGQRIVAMVVVGALVAGAAGFLGWSVLFHSAPEVRSQLTGWQVEDEHRLTATATVVRAASQTRASCVAQALAEDHAVVGVWSAAVDSGAPEQSVAFEIRTERHATAVRWLGCTAPDQPRPR